MMLGITACGGKKPDGDEGYVEKAIGIVNDIWGKIYEAQNMDNDGTVDIVDTRLIKIKENDNEYFKDVEAVVEFCIFTDYYGAAPYYMNVDRDDTVVFYKDGHTEVKDIFVDYMRRTYKMDFSDVIGEVKEYGTEYNTKTEGTADAGQEVKDLAGEALKLVKAYWKDRYEESRMTDNADGTLKVVNTKVVMPGDLSGHPEAAEALSGVKAIVEFEIFTDEYGAAPFYFYTVTGNNVIIYEDGSMKVESGLIKQIQAKTMDRTLSKSFEIYDLGDEYNGKYDVR